jgi:RHS repeat-associated protein
MKNYLNGRLGGAVSQNGTPDGAVSQNGTPDGAVGQNGSPDFAKTNLLEIPAINLPKGGGALKSIDEKFEVNAASGTTSLRLTIPLPKSRGDFAPALSLEYNSGSGNGAFGLGWNIDLHSIRRRTDKLLPKYQDATNSDIFQLSGMDDLVVRLIKNSGGGWSPDEFTTGSYHVKRFRPRVDGPFTLIEQVTSKTGMYWKTTSKDNVITFYGLTPQSRVADPADATHIFEWLPEISYDDKGNCIQFEYVAEDLVNVPALLHEGNRLNGNQPIANTYLKRIVYGNTTPYGWTTDPYSPVIPADPYSPVIPADPYLPVIPADPAYLFSLVLDYGDHDLATPTPIPSTTWGCRLDPFSNGKPGFDRRTYRLCRRFLIFHQFTELDTQPVLVKSIDLTYQYYNFQPVADPYTLTLVEADFITTVTETGWIGTAASGYQSKSYPPVTFTYQLPNWDSTVQSVSNPAGVNIPEGLVSPYQFTDLYNEGIAGVLSEQGKGWYYSHNLGDATFTPASLIAPKPDFTGLNTGDLQLQTLTGDGRKFIVSTQPPHQGFFELTDDTQQWLPFTAFDRYPGVDLRNPNIKFIDLNGDGMPDIVLSEEDIFTWYPAAGITGYDSPELAPKPFDEEKGPAIVFADPIQSIFLSDMTGAGLTDIVRIRNGEISYWPNLGYGAFGAKVNMSNAPLFDTIDQFNPAYLHLADINGTGATDILYLGQDKLRAWLNLSGNAWGPAWEATAFPDTASPNQLSVADLLGNGTACIIWSSPLAGNADTPLRYIDLMGGNKPYLMNGYNNGMGKQVSLTYRSSTYFYLQDKLAGTPWITKLCFPVQCVAAVRIEDGVSGNSYSSSYTYHHGYYDHPEKEYRGFGRVEQTDTDIFDTNAAADQLPVLTKTWYHTGAYFGIGNILHQLAAEYFKNPSFTEYNLPEPLIPSGLTPSQLVPSGLSPDEAREAARACKGMTLRQEIYALSAPNPYTAAEHNNNIILLQPQGSSLYASYLVTESETLTYHYEQNPADPRIQHTLNTAFDPYGNIIDSYSVVYPRQPVNPANPGGITLPGMQPLPAAVMAEQAKTYIVYTHNAYTAAIISSAAYRLPVGCETIAYELTGISPSATYYSISDFTSSSASPTLTKLKHQRTLFLKNDLQTPLPLYTMDTLGLAWQHYHLAFNATVTALSGRATTALLEAARYIESDAYITAGYFPVTDATGEWWVPAGTINYLNAGSPLPFLQPYQYLDVYGYATTMAYDSYWLQLLSVTDPLGNVFSAVYDYRVLNPQSVTDPNGNETDFRYDTLGWLIATAVLGKGEGDFFDASFTSDLSTAQVTAFFSDPFTTGPALLGNATSRFIYHFPAGGPFSTGTISRQIHANQTPDPRVPIASLPYQFNVEYTDGLGRIAMKKIQGDQTTGSPQPGACDGTAAPQHQWIGSGKTVYNNKGKPVMQYEPYFSPTSAYEEAPANGVTAVLYYDPLDRLIRTAFPDGSFSMTAFDAWVQIDYDRNDTVLDSSWYPQALAAADPKTNDAANKAAAHNDTPSAAHLDPLGRNFYTVAYNKTYGVSAFYAAQTVLDLEGNPLSVIDAAGNTVVTSDFDLLNRPIHQVSMDAGQRWLLHDAMDKPIAQWDINGANTIDFTFSYDALHRPLQSTVQINGSPYLSGYNVYGEGIFINGASDTTNNLRGKLYRQFDDSGLLTHYCYDFKGNLVQSSRRFATAFQPPAGSAPSGTPATLIPLIPWTGNMTTDLALLSPEEYLTLATYDALNRVILQLRPFLPLTPGALVALPYTAAATNNADCIVPGYGESGALNTVDLYYGGGTTPTPFVSRISHNEKGQRLCIQYGNNTVTRYTYDPDTFRMTRLLTTINKGITILQDIRYYYDPVGNITYILDNAQPPVFYNNQQVLSDGSYTYDAIYQVLSATGREQVGQNTVDEGASNNNLRNYPFMAAAIPAPTDPLAMRSYTQNYTYDAVGNMTELQHVATGGGYTRLFTYNKNQLLSTTIGAGPAVNYAYDGHGNMQNLPELPGMAWNYKDQLTAVTQQAVSNGGLGLTTYYSYEAGGTRSRKVTVSASTGSGGSTAPVSERLYIGNFEIYRAYDGAGNITLQRETLHVMDDTSRIAMIDRKTIDTGGADPTLVNTYYPRYQYGNQLGSAAYELDDSANIISYEEYHPYGTTSYQATNAALDVPARRYRYTGKERDEESGLYYHGARYYAPWLCRWTAADPIGIKDGLNIYLYVTNNPVRLWDPEGTLSADNQTFVDDTKTYLTARVKEVQQDINTKTAAVDAQIAKERPTTEALLGKKYDKKVKKDASFANTISKQDFINQAIAKTRADELKARGIDKLTDQLNKLQGLKNFFSTHTFTDDSLTLANVVTNEAGVDPQASKEAVAYGYLNRTGGTVRNPQGAEISHFVELQDRLPGMSDKNDKDTFLTEMKDSVAAAETRIADTKNQHDPTQGATHWISPKAHIFDKRNGGNTQKRTIDGKTRFVPDWARANNDPKLKSLQTGPNASLNKNFKEITGITDFLFYRGVKF